MSSRIINDVALDLIKSFEGLMDGDPRTVNLDPYLDPVGIWTIGWGHAIRVAGRFLKGKENEIKARALYPLGISRAQAEELLRQDIAAHTRDLDGLVKVELNENQYGALASLIFNIGAHNLSKSTLLKLVNAEKFEEAADQFPLWSKAGGKRLPGLVRRRKAERKLFLTPVVTVALPAETVKEQEAQEADLLSVAAKSEVAKSAGKKLWPRLAGSVGYLFTLYQANQLIGNILIVVLLGAIGILIYYKWSWIKSQLLKRLK